MKILLLVFLLSLILSVNSGTEAQTNNLPLIPYPERVKQLDGNFILSSKTYIKNSNKKILDYFLSQIKIFTGLQLEIKNESDSKSIIFFRIEKHFSVKNKEAYSLSVTRKEIVITAPDEEGLFRGMQTLFQLIPASIKAEHDGSPVNIPCCKILDEPKFKWRGLMLDCARHFMSVDFIKRYIDILAYYKFNVLHWHLTDDQGWRIEIKKYPKLTQIGAWRKEPDGSTYGGYYTQKDIKEIVAYAKSRFITVVPEIEMPGHCMASLAAYPENSCTGGPFEVPDTWGVFKDVYCAGRDSTFYFLKNILNEVIKLFPGKYIHIGGDEVPKDRWKACPRCQARIKTLGLKNEDGLQSYFIKRISNYLNSKGKHVIGWDEILKGGLAPGAIVESWQGTQGALDAAAQGHYVICSPASHTYLDADPENLDLRIAYSFNPIPKDLPADEQKYILGGEACLWTERAPQETVDRKLFPRLLALSEVFWSDPQDSNFDEFHSRVEMAYDDLNARGIQYGPETKAISFKTSFDEVKKEFTVTIIPGQKDLEIRYTEDGSEPDTLSSLYTSPIIINKTINLKVAAFRKNVYVGKEINLSFVFDKALNANLTLINKYDERYRAGGPNALIDGIRGTDNFRDGLWQGYSGEDFEGIIDLKKETEISKVSPRFLQDAGSWIFMPKDVKVSLSKDGKNYFDEKTITNDVPQKNPDVVLKDFTAEYKNQKARYIKVIGESIKKCPPWHPGAGQDAWLFIDEIVVE